MYIEENEKGILAMKKRFLLGLFIGAMLIYLGIYTLGMLKSELAENAASQTGYYCVTAQSVTV